MKRSRIGILAAALLGTALAVPACAVYSGPPRPVVVQPAPPPAVVVQPAPPPAVVVQPAPPPATVYVYDYYPSCEAYYCPTRGLWFWWGGGCWQSGVVLPSYVVIDPVERVSLSLNVAMPYTVHQTVVVKHPPGRGKHGRPPGHYR